VSSVEAVCAACGFQLEPPNVRAASSATERSALNQRCSEAEAEATRRGEKAAFDDFLERVRQYSRVAVCMPASVARTLITDARTVFANYEHLVGAGMRIPAQASSDRHRLGVVGTLFGSYANEIRYGVLTMASETPMGYGPIACELFERTVASRVSFLERNSYSFVKEHELSPSSPIPPGYRAVWDNRHRLVGAKLGAPLRRGVEQGKWNDLLLRADADREREDFIEAHIFGGFNLHAIKRVWVVPSLGSLSRDDALDAEIVLAAFERLSASRS